MKSRLGLLAAMVAGACAGSAPLSAQEAPAPAPSEAARRAAYDLAGAFANDGFRIRDGHLAGELEPGRAVVMEASVAEGAACWFVAAAAEPARRIAISLHGEDGRVLPGVLYYEAGPVVAAGWNATRSGQILVRLELIEGGKAPFCLINCIK